MEDVENRSPVETSRSAGSLSRDDTEGDASVHGKESHFLALELALDSCSAHKNLGDD